MTTLTIGGKERKLYFESWGFMEYVGEWIKDDPFNVFEVSMTDTAKAPKAIQAILYGALMNACNELGQQPDFTKEDIVKWARSLKFKDSTALFNGAASGMSGGEEKNAETQAQQPNA